ncbi:hypothetical protein Syun_006293 [Stephania yunnanensis]|uniref:Myosin motor domain-containing protein n=1 Tax=Stephania yunnanensis TaxID=152371 RepID=A0AAP0PXE9_9MAGN
MDIVQIGTHWVIAVTSAAKLMGCNVQDLISALSSYRTQAGNDNIVQKLTLLKAIQTRDAMAKFMYSGLSLDVEKRNAGKSISISDICGFESFQENGFQRSSGRIILDFKASMEAKVTAFHQAEEAKLLTKANTERLPA